MALHSQYNTLFLNGKIAMKNGDYIQAITYFDSASFLFPHFHKPYFEAVICATQLGDYEKAYNIAVKMILTGSSFSISQEVLGGFCETDYYKLLKSKEDSLYKLSMQERDTAFANAIFELYRMNQSKGIQKDTITFYKFIDICEQKKVFPSYLNVGTDAYRKAFWLLKNSYWHSGYPKSKEWLKLLPLITNEFMSGGIEAYVLPEFEDAYRSNNNIPLKYGIFSMDYQNDTFLPIENLNKNRKEVGLAPFELDAKCLDINLNSLQYNNGDY
jgi:hypothetical protein